MAVTQAQAREQPAQRPGAEKSLADTGWGWQAGVGRAGSGGSVGHRWCLKLCLSACGEITVAWVESGSHVQGQTQVMVAVVSVCLDEMRGPPGWDYGVDERWTPERLRVRAQELMTERLWGCKPGRHWGAALWAQGLTHPRPTQIPAGSVGPMESWSPPPGPPSQGERPGCCCCCSPRQAHTHLASCPLGGALESLGMGSPQWQEAPQEQSLQGCFGPVLRLGYQGVLATAPGVDFQLRPLEPQGHQTQFPCRSWRRPCGQAWRPAPSTVLGALFSSCLCPCSPLPQKRPASSGLQLGCCLTRTCSSP